MTRPLSAILLLLSVLSSTAVEAGERPNFLFIIVDDQSPFDLRLYDADSKLDTPNIDRIAAEGMTFDAAYHMGSFSGAVCTPSRHMVMTGRTVWHLPNSPGRNGCPPNMPDFTMAAVFNRAGYDTMRTCKRGNSYAAANAQFTVVKDATKRGGTEETGSAWHGKQVLEFLDQREAASDAAPFFIYFGFSHPHDTRDGTPELLKKYGAVNHTDKNNLPVAHPDQPPLPVNYLAKHPFHHGHPGLRDEVAVSGVWENRDPQTIRNELGRQFACDENIDIQIGKVLKKLADMGELENTYVVYTADHGMAIGRHGLQGKQNLYEHTWRVPYIVKGPGIRAGTRATGNIYLLDSLPTLCDLAGITPPETVEGKNFVPVLKQEQPTVRDVLYGVYNGGTKPGMRCVRKGDWKLIKYDVLDGEVRETQLFNLAANPDEFIAEHEKSGPLQSDLAEDPKYADKLKEMEDLLLAEMRRLDDPWRLWNQPDDGLTPPAAQKRKPGNKAKKKN
ncbi:MAG: sulfatase-like hydrolase/transferase [Fuerstiella sp.]